MKTRAALIVAVLGTASSVFAQAQTQGSITYNLSFAEFNHGTGTAGSPTEWLNPVAGNIAGGTSGTIDPGEGALLKLTVVMSGTPGGFDQGTQLPTGTTLTWNAGLTTIPPGSSGTGGLSGLWGGDVNLHGSEATGTFSDTTTFFGASVRRRLLTFTAGGGSGFVNGDLNGRGPAGDITDIQPAQFNPDADALNHSNNVLTWQGLWIPAHTLPTHTVTWQALLGSLGFPSQIAAMDINYGNGYTFSIPLNVQTLFGPSVSIPVSGVPGPSSLALLGLGGLVAARRRR